MDEKETLPAVKEEQKVKKKSEIASLAEGFVADAGRGLLSYFVNEHLIPFMDRTIRSIADRMLRKLGGTIEDTGSGRDSNYKNYGKLSAPVERRIRDKKEDDPFGLNQLIFKTKSEAQRILKGLEEACYGGRIARVADLYQLLEEDFPFTANYWGWTSMNGAEIVLCSEGWRLKLPRIMEITRI